MMKKIFQLIFFTPILYFSQAGNGAPVVFPKPPDANYFSDYTNLPSGSFTGVPDINIPLFSFDVDGTSVPITLRYVSTGIKVDEIASRVGLGWMLDIGGGGIVRNVIGRPDAAQRQIKSIYNVGDKCYGDTNDKDYFKSLTIEEADPFLGTPTAPGADTRPDIYDYMLLGEKGRFLYDRNGDALLIPKSDAKINPRNFSDGTHFNILDGKGISYDFISTNRYYPIQEASYNYYIHENFFKPEKILFPSGKKIEYKYEQAFGFIQYSSYEQEAGNTNYNSGTCHKNIDQIKNIVEAGRNAENVLTSIVFDQGKIFFDYDENQRTDLPGDHPLSGIRVVNNFGKLVKKFSFHYDYFNSDDYIELPFYDYVNGINGINKRLKLSYIKEELSDAQYSFDYY